MEQSIDLLEEMTRTTLKRNCDFGVNYFDHCPIRKTVPFHAKSDRHFAIVLFFEDHGPLANSKYAADPTAHLILKSPGEQIGPRNLRYNARGLYLQFTERFLMNQRQLLSLLSSFPFLEISLLKNNPLQIGKREAATIEDLVRKIFEEYHFRSDNGDYIIVNAYLQAFLLTIKRIYDAHTERIGTTNDPDQHRPKEIIRKFKSLLWVHSINNNDRAFDRKKIADYAELLLIHPNYLYAVVKKETGKTAREFIDDQIFRLAKTLLLQEDVLIKEIAWQLSFSDTSHFSTFFRRRAGIAPVTYRKQRLCNTPLHPKIIV